MRERERERETEREGTEQQQVGRVICFGVRPPVASFVCVCVCPWFRLP